MRRAVSSCGGREASAPPCLSYRRYSSSSSTVDRHLKELIIGVSFPLSPHMFIILWRSGITVKRKTKISSRQLCTCSRILTRYHIPTIYSNLNCQFYLYVFENLQQLQRLSNRYFFTYRRKKIIITDFYSLNVYQVQNEILLWQLN